MKTLRALLVAHASSQWNRTLRDSGLAEKASAAMSLGLVGVILAIPCLLVFKYGLSLGRRFAASPDDVLLEWCALQAIFSLTFAILGGFRNKLAFTFKELGRFPLPRFQVLLAEIPASLFEGFPILGLAGILFSHAGFVISQPLNAPFILLLAVHSILIMLLTLSIAGSLKRFLFKRRNAVVITGLLLLFAWIVSGKLDFHALFKGVIGFLFPMMPGGQADIQWLPNAQAYFAFADLISGRVTSGLLRLSYSLGATFLLLFISAWVHHRELTTEVRLSGSGMQPSSDFKFSRPHAGVCALFIKELLDSASGKLTLFIPLMFTGGYALILWLMRTSQDNGDSIPVLESALKYQENLPVMALLLYGCILIDSDIWMNQFGWDRHGIRLLISLPISFESILLGKMLGLFQFTAIQILLASAPLLIVHSLDIRELICAIGAAGTYFVLSAGIGQLISVQYPRAVNRTSDSTVKLHLSWIPMVILTIALATWITGSRMGARLGNWGEPVCLLAIFALSLAVYRLALPSLARRMDLSRDRLLTM